MPANRPAVLFNPWRAWLLIVLACWACLAPHALAALAPDLAQQGPKTRVGDFLANRTELRPAKDAQVTESHQANMLRGYKTASGQPNFYSTDHLGSVREMTDASGAVRARYDYDPYGRLTKVSGDLEADFGFTGHYRHQASGLNLTLFRAYDPELGRWLSREPLGEMGPDGPNAYAYVQNNPVNYFDPDGLLGVSSLNRPDGPLVMMALLGITGASFIAVKNNMLPTEGFSSCPLNPFQESFPATPQEIIREVIEIVNIPINEQFAPPALDLPNSISNTFPSNPSDMDQILGVRGIPKPDTVDTPGRNRTDWFPKPGIKITFEQHPYHPDAPSWHSGPHWHVDTPGKPHQRFAPGDTLPPGI